MFYACRYKFTNAHIYILFFFSFFLYCCHYYVLSHLVSLSKDKKKILKFARALKKIFPRRVERIRLSIYLIRPDSLMRERGLTQLTTDVGFKMQRKNFLLQQGLVVLLGQTILALHLVQVGNMEFDCNIHTRGISLITFLDNVRPSWEGR